MLAAGSPELRPRRNAGFTVLELLIVVAIVAMASAGVTLSLRDGKEVQLEREAERLVALLEAARARSQLRRAFGLMVWMRRSSPSSGWTPTPVHRWGRLCCWGQSPSLARRP